MGYASHSTCNTRANTANVSIASEPGKNACPSACFSVHSPDAHNASQSRTNESNPQLTYMNVRSRGGGGGVGGARRASSAASVAFFRFRRRLRRFA